MDVLLYWADVWGTWRNGAGNLIIQAFFRLVYRYTLPWDRWKPTNFITGGAAFLWQPEAKWMQVANVQDTLEVGWKTPQLMLGLQTLFIGWGYFAGWWFGTFFIFPYIGNNHPNWLSYFSEGWPNHQPDVFCSSRLGMHRSSGSILYKTPFRCRAWRATATALGNPTCAFESLDPCAKPGVLCTVCSLICLFLSIYTYIYIYMYVYMNM